MNAIYWDKKVGAAEKFIYLFLRDFCDKHGVKSVPVNATDLMDMCGIKKRETLRNKIKALEAAGYIKTKQRQGDNGAFGSNVYTILK